MSALVLLALLVQVPPPPPPPGGPPPRAQAGQGPLRQKVRERMNMMRMWKLTEALNLDEPTAQRLFPLLNRFDERLQPIHRQQADLALRLRIEVESPRPDPNKLNAAIDQMLALRHQAAAIEDERTREVRRVLTPVQQAKLVLLLPRIEKELRREVRRAMNLPVEDD